MRYPGESSVRNARRRARLLAGPPDNIECIYDPFGTPCGCDLAAGTCSTGSGCRANPTGCSGNGELVYELCLEALEGLAEQDRRTGGPVRDDVWRAVEAVAGAARDEGLFGARAADHLVRMRDLLDAEPEWGRTPAYHMAYSKAVSPSLRKRSEHESGAWRALEVESLRRAVALDPGDGRAGLMLARALYAAGRKDEAIEACRGNGQRRRAAPRRRAGPGLTDAAPGLCCGRWNPTSELEDILRIRGTARELSLGARRGTPRSRGA